MRGDYAQILGWMMPVAVLVATGLAILLVDLVWGGGRTREDRLKVAGWLGLVGAVGAGGVIWGQGVGRVGSSWVVSPTIGWVQGMLVGLTGLSAVLGRSERGIRHVGEFYALMYLAAAGMVTLVSTENILVLFVALEWVSLSLYCLVGLGKERGESAEGALKYFLAGGVAAAFLWFGLSWLYGATGSGDYSTIQQVLSGGRGGTLVRVAWMAILVGFGFKIAAAPFHLWAPDVYQGGAGAAVGFVASASKVAGLVALGRLGWGGLGSVSGMGEDGRMREGWGVGVVALSLGSMVIGNLAALRQSDLRRLLAYSAIGQGGYALLGYLSYSGPDGMRGVAYFGVTYAMSVLGMFGVMSVRGVAGDRGGMDRLRGLFGRAPFLGICSVIFLLSMAGIPPLAGFMAKFWVFRGLLRPGAAEGNVGLLAVGLAMSCVALYYYLRVLRVIFEEPVGEETEEAKGDFWVRCGLGILALGTVVMGMAPRVP